MSFRNSGALHVGLVLVLLLLVSPVLAEEPVVKVVMFYSDACPHCHDIMDDFLPPMQEKYGDRLQVELISIDDIEGYRLLMFVDDMAGIPEDRRGVPEMLIGSTIMVGSISIREHFEETVDQYLEAGGVDTPGREELVRQMQAAVRSTATPNATVPLTPELTPVPASPTVAAPSATPSLQPADPVYLAYLYQPGCPECDRAEYDLRLLEHTYPQLVVERYSSVDDAPLAEWLGERYSLPPEQRLSAPAVFVGDHYLLSHDVTYSRLEALVRQYVGVGGAPRVWDGWEAEKEEAEARVLSRYRSFGLATVMAAGLIDGVNPCAFATLVFLVSYLSFAGRTRRQVLAAGGSFTAAVFLTYFGVGLGLYRLLASLPALAILGKVIYGITAVACLVLAGMSIYDFFQARRGRAAGMTLRLPTRLRRQVNRVIRESMGPGTAAVAAFVAGVVVSVVELACTGQVYLPTLMFVAGRPELRANAVGALLLYNLAFVTPLIVVFALAAGGTGSDRLRGLLARHTATVKLLTAALFLALAIWLVSLLL